ncbi:MAG: helix-turn-helix domain-containing protein [Zoogloea sp.]|uniref:helix-turn-helix domain-containing protein n=1 Tax=Zoogloea sp. TaxID=49181 RepID=UPI0026111023|nr:helix-turn-helix domain-containing protein [Zoogloea sp.]MDD2989101.1 helix-turn-helix domain-containing protein [Zoogloea sp.]
MTTLDLQGAAALMKIHPVTLGRMINDGKIPAARIGRAYVLMERDVLGYVEQQIGSQTAMKRGKTRVADAEGLAARIRRESDIAVRG